VDPTKKENQSEVKTSSASKPWLIVNVPQMTQDSGNDICLKKDGSLCIIMVVKDAASVDKTAMEQIGLLGEEYESKISRGIAFRFMWLDASTETEFANIFELESYPQIVVMNPGKRKRFLIHKGELTSNSVKNTLELILSGDARFKAIKGNKLPELVSKYPTE